MNNKKNFNLYFMDNNRKLTTKAIIEKNNYYIYDGDKKYDLSDIGMIGFATKTEYPFGILKMKGTLKDYSRICLLDLINSANINYNYPLINTFNLHYDYYDKQKGISYYDFLRMEKNYIKIENLEETTECEVLFGK